MSGLISADHLQTRLGSPGLVILDTRSGPGGAGLASFEAAHIPGARHTDYAADGWRARVGQVPGMLPDAGHLAALFARLGLERGQQIVIVPAGLSVSELAGAARIYWTLKVCGFNPAGMLDGGMAGWLAEGRPLAQGPVTVAPAGVPALSVDPALRADAAATLTALEASQTLLDARAASYFAGLEKAPEARVAGHIPGAVQVDYSHTYDALRQRLRPRADLEALFAGVGEGPVVTYCNTGHTAALNWFVLSEVLGRPAVRLYDGSMTDWTQDPARPVSTLT